MFVPRQPPSNSPLRFAKILRFTRILARNVIANVLLRRRNLTRSAGLSTCSDRTRDLRDAAMISGLRCAIRRPIKRSSKIIGRNTLKGWFRVAAPAMAMFVAGGIASAQSPFPSKPVHIFVPYSAGGGVDILARTLADMVSRQWGQAVVVENRPGAGGVVASQALVTSAPDGYTLIVVASGHATNPFLYPKLPYDTFRDFTPISLLASSPNILLVRADSPFKTVADVIAQARLKPGSLSFAHAGNGTSTHLAGELLKNLAKIDLEAIPYKGGAPAINDLLGGQIAMSFNNGPESVGQLEAGTVRALAVTTGTRAAFLPDVPSMAETVPGYATEVWWGLLGPAGMPADLVEKLAHDFVAALNTDSVKQRLTKLGASPIGSTSRQFDEKIHADYEKWGPIIKAAGMKAE